LRGNATKAESTFNLRKVILKEAHGIAFDELAKQERGLKAEREKHREEFPVFVNALDVLAFGSGSGRHEMVFIPQGDFVMGALEDDRDAYSEEESCHKVTLTKDFWIGKYAVTQSLWKSVLGANPLGLKITNQPVEQVSWFDAVNFANKLSELEGLEPAYTINGDDVSCNWNAKGFRLPTEAEWECSARAGESFKYAGSSNVAEVAWYAYNSGRETHPVGQRKPNGFGLYDMSGNVWEWVWDWYGAYSSVSQSDPTGVSTGSNRVLRGGAWSRSLYGTRASDRNRSSPTYRNNSFGFRLVLPL
jgi:formylglycine-generating enzyme required for sulfatase activity